MLCTSYICVYKQIKSSRLMTVHVFILSPHFLNLFTLATGSQVISRKLFSTCTCFKCITTIQSLSSLEWKNMNNS